MATLAQIKLLINLAQADGAIGDLEKNYIINIGRANQMYPDEVEPLFYQQHEVVVPDNLTNDQKFEYIFSLVQLMKVDERMYKPEIQFCSRIAVRLGYQQQAMFDLLLHVRGEMMEHAEKDALKQMMTKYLHPR
jgi:uncharacterized tellurite resistance protein B-like protein